MAALPDHTPEAPPPDTELDPADRHLQPVPDDGLADLDTPAEADTTAPEVAEAELVDEQVEDVESEPVRSGWSRLTEHVRIDAPLFTDRPYAAAEVWQRARHGAQVAESGPLRVVAGVYGVVATAAAFTANAAIWVVATPTRAALITALVVLATLSPIGQGVLAAVTWLPAEIHTVTTD